MNKLLLIILLAIFSTGAMAEWTYVGESDSANIYIDIASKRNSGKKVKLWSLMDYKKPMSLEPSEQILPTVEQDEYDCFNETASILHLTDYTENMQTGSVIKTYTYKPAEYKTPITPNTVKEILFKVACGKK